MAPVREPEGLLEGSDDRPADVFLPAWSNGKGACLDFTCTSAMQAALVEGCAVDGAHAAEHAHQLKVRKYSARCEREGLVFIPMAVDTFGRWHPKALEVITTLGRQLARNVGREGGEAVRHLRQRLGVMLVRDSVAMLCARTPTFAPPEVDGDLDRDEPRPRSEPRVM